MRRLLLVGHVQRERAHRGDHDTQAGKGALAERGRRLRGPLQLVEGLLRAGRVAQDEGLVGGTGAADRSRVTAIEYCVAAAV